jgi:hypothetical protein
MLFAVYERVLLNLFWWLTTIHPLCLYWLSCPGSDPTMTTNDNHKTIGEALIKFHAPEELKLALQALASERNITLSALLRLVMTEYVKRNQRP